MGFSSGIYKSWENIQKEKFRQMKKQLGRMNDSIFGNKLVLDIGCGSGYLESAFKGKFVGVDKDISMIKNSVEIFPKILADAEYLPFKEDSFDVVVSIDTMHTIKGDDFKRVLKNDGILLLSIFFNNENYLDRRKILLDKLSQMTVLKEFELHGREKEYVIVARKT